MSTVFVTMVYNDQFFLDVWVRYYEKHTDRKNLHIVTHGPGQDYVHDIAKGCTILEAPRDPRNPRLDADRFAFMSDYCSDLTKTFDRVIFNDVDELVVLDPEVDMPLVEYLEAVDPAKQVVTPLGLEIIHMKMLENDYDYARGMFAQRKFVRVNGWYSKPCITNTPIVWGPDGHGSSYGEINVDPNLYLFHLKWFDDKFHIDRHKERLKQRWLDDDGKEVIVGSGSWAWSERRYQIATNRFMRMPIDIDGQGFDLTAYREKLVKSFTPRLNPVRNMYLINGFRGNDLKIIPERFIGTV